MKKTEGPVRGETWANKMQERMTTEGPVPGEEQSVGSPLALKTRQALADTAVLAWYHVLHFLPSF